MTKRSSQSIFVSIVLECAEAQVITGNLLGTVRDESGAVLPGAVVTIRSPALLGGPATFATNEKVSTGFPRSPPGWTG